MTRQELLGAILTRAFVVITSPIWFPFWLLLLLAAYVVEAVLIYNVNYTIWGKQK
jgi:hypothetical protein